MRNKLLFSSVLLAASVSLSAQKSATITLHADQGTQVIPKEIYGQFAEHLGTCIYGGLWVGENSDIPNIKGYRTDVFNALKELQIPVLRWPGGCFADEYHWMDGIGPKEKRKKMIKTKYGQKAVRHSKRGVYSCTYAVVIAFLVIVMILFSFMNKGNVNILMGFFGLGTCAMAVIGIWLGIKGFREREKIYTTCKVGITVNAVFLVAMVALFVRGLM